MTGKEPWSGYTLAKLTKAMIKEERPPTPTADELKALPLVTQSLWAMAMDCWAQEPGNRPTFARLATILQQAFEAYLKNTPNAQLLTAAAYAFANFYSKPYPEHHSANSAYYMDWAPVFGVERPNHGLANAMRKALLVELIVEAIRKFSKQTTFNFGSSMLQAMQVAMLFAKPSALIFTDLPPHLTDLPSSPPISPHLC